jgi:ribosomal protein S4
MRFINRYKGYNKLFSIFEKFPLRIGQFKSTKWKRVQRLLSFKTKKKKARNRKPRRKLFFNNFLTKVSTKTWYRVENYYENGRRLKTAVSSLFDKTLPTRFYRKTLNLRYKSGSISQMYSNTLIRPEFRIDILLWRLSFFRSCYQASQAISEKKVKVNDKCIKGNFFLTKGDIITFSSSRPLSVLSVKNVRSNFLFSKKFSTFVEVDYYSNCIIVLKSFDDLSLEDFYILVKEHYSLKKIKDYI